MTLRMFCTTVFSTLLATTAWAQEQTDQGAPDEGEATAKQPKAGDFDAGGQVRLPSGPDADGAYATFNWVAVDLRARYYLTRTVTVDAVAPLALIHPDELMGGIEPATIGGFYAVLDARLPKLPRMPFTPYDVELGVKLAAAYAHEGAMLLGDKDFPLYVGGYQPGFATGLVMRVKLSNAVDFALVPTWVHQNGELENANAVQVPTSLILKLGNVVKVSADAGVYTGDDYALSADNGGRITAGGSLELKIGPILAHAGAGVASLLPGGLYPTIRDSVYVDLNVKYAK